MKKFYSRFPLNMLNKKRSTNTIEKKTELKNGDQESIVNQQALKEDDPLPKEDPKLKINYSMIFVLFALIFAVLSRVLEQVIKAWLESLGFSLP